jgi:hypothetical protein
VVGLFDSNILINVLGYIDPGSVSAFMAVIIGAFAGVGMTLKLYWHKIKFKLSK